MGFRLQIRGLFEDESNPFEIQFSFTCYLTENLGSIDHCVEYSMLYFLFKRQAHGTRVIEVAPGVLPRL